VKRLPPEMRDPTLVALVALAVRLAVVAWAAGAIPPTADGAYYDVVARRIAQGQGYTWLWPDGAVTYAAHYPVGYPALVGLGYALFGARPVVAMILNALVGTAGAVAAHDLLRRATAERVALWGGVAVALHPALVPYTAALMTEGVTASLLVVAAALAARRRLASCALVLGAATLVRPQSILLAPLFGLLVPSVSARARVLFAAALLGATLLVCAPWTVRNCYRMNRCALVSVNGGWNLAIGTQTTDGAWRELDVPDACKTVWEEAAKDDCFGRDAARAIAASPGAWLARVPSKLSATFDYFGAGPWYLHAANAGAFPTTAKLALAGLEVAACRLSLAGALVAVARWRGPRKGTRWVLAAVGLVACVAPPAAVGYLALAVAILALGARALAKAPAILGATAAVIAATAATHAVFFGAGRYGLVVVPFVTALAFVAFAQRKSDGDAARTAAKSESGQARDANDASTLSAEAIEAAAAAVSPARDSSAARLYQPSP
jgi:4-amino-4-deoxy-L-arabinose transferase-like glycosyltransferase